MLNLMKYEARRQVFSKGIILGIFFVLVAAFLGFYWQGVETGVTMMLALMSFAALMVILFASFSEICIFLPINYTFIIFIVVYGFEFVLSLGFDPRTLTLKV